jgi:hypothetical protein
MERKQLPATELPPLLANRLSTGTVEERRLRGGAEGGLDSVFHSSQCGLNGAGLAAPPHGAPVEDSFIPSESLRDQLLAIRRRLWIVNATLESLPAKIEQTYQTRNTFLGGDRCVRECNPADRSCPEARSAKRRDSVAPLWARWRLAKLRSRAVRAERRAAAALYTASVSFGEALEAVLLAAVARVKADEACSQSLPRSFSAESRSRK